MCHIFTPPPPPILDWCFYYQAYGPVTVTGKLYTFLQLLFDSAFDQIDFNTDWKLVEQKLYEAGIKSGNCFMLNFALLFMYCCHPFNLKLKPSSSQPTHFQELFRKSSNYVNTNKGSIVKQSDNDVEGCGLKRFCFNPICTYFCNTV